MDIQVKDFNAASSICESIARYSAEINAEIDSLDSIITNVNSKWSSTGQDKEAYMQELRKQAENLTFINQQIDSFVKNVNQYLATIQETRNKTI